MVEVTPGEVDQSAIIFLRSQKVNDNVRNRNRGGNIPKTELSQPREPIARGKPRAVIRISTAMSVIEQRAGVLGKGLIGGTTQHTVLGCPQQA